MLRQLLGFALAAAFLAAAVTSFYVGKNYRTNELCCEIPPLRNLLASAKEVAGLIEFHSTEGQDRWVALEAFPGVRDGYFVDLGAADGVRKSNTKVLEDLGWSGLCVDPFPANMETRRCTVFTVPVYSVSGKRVSFRKARDLGGIEAHMGRWEEATRHVESVELSSHA